MVNFQHSTRLLVRLFRMESLQRDAGAWVGMGSGTGTFTFLGTRSGLVHVAPASSASLDNVLILCGKANHLSFLCNPSKQEPWPWHHLPFVPAGCWTLVTVW